MFLYRFVAPKKSPVEKVMGDTPKILEGILKKYMRRAQTYAKKQVSGGGKAKDRLNVRTGRLRSSITKAVIRKDTKFQGIIGTNVPYARIHEEGGTIRPVTGKYLTIPLSKTKAGVARWKASDFALAETAIFPDKDGDLFIWAAKGKKGKMTPIFRLVTEVKIPKRPYLMPALEKVKPAVMDEIAIKINRASEGE